MQFKNSYYIKYYMMELPKIKTLLFKLNWCTGKYICEVQEISITRQTQCDGIKLNTYKLCRLI